MISLIRKTTLPFLAAVALITPALAGPPDAILTEHTPATPAALTGYDRVWSHFTLYKSDDNDVLQEFSLQGRIQLQYAIGDADQGNYGSDDRPPEVRWGDDIEVRRWRLGFKSKWFRQWKLDGQIDVNPDWDPFYRQIYDLNLTYAPSDAINIGIGKYKANNFGIEQVTSSKEILTFERSLLANQLFAGELTGARFSGKKDNWVYAAGIYSGDITPEFSDFETGTVFQASLGYDFHEMIGIEKALVRLDWQHSSDASNGMNVGDEPRISATSSGIYENGFSLNGHFEQGKWGLYSDLVTASGRGTTGDVWGITFIPSYYLTDGLQLVGRYQYAHGDNDGIRLQSRYERLTAPPTGRPGLFVPSTRSGFRHWARPPPPASA